MRVTNAVVSGGRGDADRTTQTMRGCRSTSHDCRRGGGEVGAQGGRVLRGGAAPTGGKDVTVALTPLGGVVVKSGEMPIGCGKAIACD